MRRAVGGWYFGVGIGRRRGVVEGVVGVVHDRCLLLLLAFSQGGNLFKKEYST